MPGHLTITTCTNRKRVPAHPLLCASVLTPGTQQEVSTQWRDAVVCAAQLPSGSEAREVYCGRSFQEAVAASESSDALWIISAGLGLVVASDQIPSYSLTIIPGARDSIRGCVDSFNVRDWWQHVAGLPTSKGTISTAVRDSKAATIVLAISLNYYSLVEADLLNLIDADLERIRIVGVAPTRVASKLESTVMPYDDRLNGPDSPIPGTRSDYPQRCARHFVGILQGSATGSAERHARDLTASLKVLRFPLKHDRRRLSDEEIRATIRKHWNAVNGKSSTMLRHLRDELRFSCEQARFAELFRQVKHEKIG